MKIKNKTIILGVFGVLVLVILGLIYFIPRTEKKEVPSSTQKEEAPLEIFSLAGLISEVNLKENYLVVLQPKEEKEFKVILDEKTEILQLKFPFDLANPPKEATFTPERIPITIEDLKIGDTVSVETSINIFGKAEFDNVSRIQVLP